MGSRRIPLDRDALADEVLGQWFDDLSQQLMRRGKRTVRIDLHTGRVQVTVALRDSGGRRCILRVSRLLERPAG